MNIIISDEDGMNGDKPEAASMAKTVNLTPPLPFDTDQGILSVGQTVAANITDHKQKRVVLLYVAGPSVQKIFKTLSETGTDFKTAAEKLDPPPGSLPYPCDHTS